MSSSWIFLASRICAARRIGSIVSPGAGTRRPQRALFRAPRPILKKGGPFDQPFPGGAGIAEECGISRAPVREALYLLETEAFLMSHPKRGKCVSLPTPDGIRHRYELCGLLEGAAAKGALALPEGPWEDLEALLGRMRRGVLEGTAFEDHAALGTAFHEAILERASNPLLIAVARSSCRVISKYLMFQQWRTLYTAEELFQRYSGVYKALLTRDPRLIEEAVRAHYADSAERLARLASPHAPSAPQPP